MFSWYNSVKGKGCDFMYFFVGIKGAGMSALAMVMKRLGYEVSGSDFDKHFFTEEGLIIITKIILKMDM